jgi:bifunctional UDP-N-acetylglucosamine pyrophosphorylase/glucosamine-1-phosphate N-acetyltransferase
MTRQVDAKQGIVERECHRVVRVGVLRTTVDEYQAWWTFTPQEARDLTPVGKVNRYASNIGGVFEGEAPLRSVLMEEAELVVVNCAHEVEARPGRAARDEGMSGRLSAIVLAAGEGSRMRSSTPKPLHRLCGRPMVLHVLDALADLDLDRVVVVVGHGAEHVTATITEGASAQMTVEFVEQPQQRGTGDAVTCALSSMTALDAGEEDVIVVPGDTPLLRPRTMSKLLEHHRSHDLAATLVTAELEDPTGYGRILRSGGDRVIGVVEQVDATAEQRDIGEVNTSIYCFRRSLLAPALRRLSPSNAQGEYYLTDVIGVLSDLGHRMEALVLDDPTEASGVNDRAQLATAEAELRRRINHAWMRAGVTMTNPDAVFIDTSVALGADVTLLPGVVLAGTTTIGEGCTIGPNARLVDTIVDRGATVGVVDATGAAVGADAVVGSFVVLERGSSVAEAEAVAPFSHRSD